jgi:hypothetical protein
MRGRLAAAFCIFVCGIFAGRCLSYSRSLQSQIMASPKNTPVYSIISPTELPSELLLEKDVQPKTRTHTVVMMPSPMHSGGRRKLVNQQFLRGGWNRSQVVFIYVVGTRTGKSLEEEIPVTYAMRREVLKYRKTVQYLFTQCRDYGDEFNNPNGTSSTTCKVYEGFKYISSTYESQYVWRGADDSYLNLQMWFQVACKLPKVSYTVIL